jgi:2-phosphoglycerate kinase
MSRVIVITGDLAAGKSALADSLSLRLNIPAFKKDLIKEHYVDEYGFKSREENRALSIKAVDFMIDALTRFVKNGTDIILEANFRTDELERIKTICDNGGADVILFVLRGDINVLYQRFLDRLPTRHKAHTSIGLEQSVDKFASYINELRKEDVVFLPIIINATDLDQEEVLQKALNYLKK